ncbi:MMPL family transporter [Amycolatopsis sp. NPDC051102]|uniref:MMPL family transporter n=1 Tax=Amycolatopsis sp. NPDC051102 TaxID=3155163 RepID=UPI00342FDF6D
MTAGQIVPKRELPPAGRGKRARGIDRWLHRLAEGIVRRRKLVVVAWLVLIAACTPFAFDLPSMLTKQGASKVVPGTASADVEQLVQREFSQRSQRETLLVVAAPDVRDARVKRLLEEIDTELRPWSGRGLVGQTSSLFTTYRDAVVQYLATVRNEVSAAAPDPAARPAAVDGLVAAGQLPGELAGPAKTALTTGDAGLAEVATGVTLAADWNRFPVPLPAELVARFASTGGDSTLVTVSFTDRAGKDPDVAGLRDIGARALAASGLEHTARVHVTGELALIHDTYAKADSDNGTMETAAYVLIFVVLLLFFRAVLPAIITLVSIGLAMNVSQAALFALGHAVTLTQFTVTIMTFVMLGAGVDYSMLLSSRYRQERLAGRSARDAVVAATARSGESVLLAAAAVVLAFGATLLSPVDWIPPLGYGGLIGIPLILLAALTLTPALLAILGDRFFLLGRNALGNMEESGALSGYLKKMSALARRRRVAVLVVFLALTAPFAVVTALGKTTADPVALSPATDSKQGIDVVTGGWGAGTAFPSVVAGRVRPDLASPDTLRPAGYQAVTALTAKLASVGGVAGVDALTRPFGKPLGEAETAALPPVVRHDFLSPQGDLRIVLRLQADPYSEPARAVLKQVDAVLAADGATVGSLALGGTTRVDEEYHAALNSSFWQMVVLVSLGVLLMLLVTLRSILIPVQLIATIMLSNVWAIGITVLVFEKVLGDAIIDDLPIFLVILMMGLGMDYEIFLVTRVRDLAREGLGIADATGRAVVDTGRVITFAGLVMAGSLGTMMLSSTLMLRQYGTGLAAAVLLDATLIRMLFVPAALVLFGRWNWWLPRIGPRRRAATP